MYRLATRRGEIWVLERHKRLQERKMRVEPTLDPDEFARLAKALRQATYHAMCLSRWKLDMRRAISVRQFEFIQYVQVARTCCNQCLSLLVRKKNQCFVVHAFQTATFGPPGYASARQAVFTEPWAAGVRKVASGGQFWTLAMMVLGFASARRAPCCRVNVLFWLGLRPLCGTACS